MSLNSNEECAYKHHDKYVPSQYRVVPASLTVTDIVDGVRRPACASCAQVMLGGDTTKAQLLVPWDQPLTAPPSDAFDEDKKSGGISGWNPHSEWAGWMATPVKSPGKSSYYPFPKYTHKSALGSLKPKKSCSHHCTPFRIGPNKVYLTGSMHINKLPQTAETITHGIYFEPALIETHSILSNFLRAFALARKLKKKTDKEIIYVKWPDRGTIPVSRLMPVLKWAADNLATEGVNIEIGCMGGHGRTGTFVASLLAYMGMRPDKAIKRVRTAYCESAIETPAQEKMIREVAKCSTSKS